MKAIASITSIAILSIALSGCWFYSRPDSTTGCQKTTYGVALSSSTSENCPPAPGAAAPGTNIPESPPTLPPPATP